MRIYFVLFWWAAISPLWCQEPNLAQQLQRYQERIAMTTHGERLVWMDSLTSAVEFQAEHHYDSLARATIDFALAEDSLAIAADNISDLIYYRKSYLGDPSQAVELFKQYEFLSEKLDQRDLARMYLNAGNAYQDLGENEAAIALFRKAKVLATEIGYVRYQGLSELYIGQALSMQGDFAAASKVLRNAEPYFAREKDTFNVINCKIALSILYSQNGFYKEAQDIRTEAIVLSEASHELENLIALHYNAATDYRKMHQNQKRIESLLASYATNQQSEFKAITEIPILSALVRAYLDVGNLTEAKRYLDHLEEDPEALLDPHKNRSYLLALKHYYFATGNYVKAIEVGEKNLAQREENQEYEELMDAEAFLANAYEKIGNPEKALRHLQRFNQLNDSINSAQKVQGLSYYQTLYETEKRDLKIKTQESDLAILAEKNKVKNQWILFGSLGLLLLFGFVLLVRSRNTYKKQQWQQALFSQELMQAQEKERTRVAKELHDSVGQQLTLIQKKAQNLAQPELASMTATTLEEVRSISRALYPPMLQKVGLTKAITQLLYEVDEETPLFVSSEIAAIDDCFKEAQTLHFFRFVQEAVHNVVKHSQAKALSVTIEKKGAYVTVHIEDNGTGFEDIESLQKNSLGLKTMAERIKMLGGTLIIDSKKGKGTQLSATLKP